MKNLLALISLSISLCTFGQSSVVSEIEYISLYTTPHDTLEIDTLFLMEGNATSLYRPNRIIYKKATMVGHSSGILKTDCRSNTWKKARELKLGPPFLDIETFTCWSCPKGYKRSIYGLRSKKACFKKVKK